jgi:hypothetical protein
MIAFRPGAAGPYVAWAAFLLVALPASHAFDPYVFGAVALALAWATVPVAVFAVVRVLLARGVPARTRAVVGIALAATFAAIAVALDVLSEIRWG